MARLSVSPLAGLAVLLLAVHSQVWAVQAYCPSYTNNGGCGTGSCKTGGLLTNYSVPVVPFRCVFKDCPLAGVVVLDGAKATVAIEASAPSCCAKCKESDKCATWQFLKTSESGSGACFLYSKVPKLTCGASYVTNVGSKCTTSGSPKFPPPSTSPPAPTLGPDCPAYNVAACGSLSCSPSGVPGNYSVPETPFPCGFGNCEFSGTILKGGKKIKLLPKPTAEECAETCYKKVDCVTWQWLKTKAGGECFMYPEGLSPVCGSTKYLTSVGIKCSLVCNDPHFVGAHGTHYDFNGEPGKSFCLVSDLRLHMNMKMTGYLDDRTESASLLVGGKAVRTWIRELGILWRAEGEGEEHSLLLAARSGKETVRGEGFLAKAEVDGVALPRMEVGEEARLAGGLAIKFTGIRKKGIYDIDSYSVYIDGLLDMTLQLRVAHPLLRRPGEAEAHISLGINWMQTTSAIHGVLGQTYREGREEKTDIFSTLGKELSHAISADGESGKGFLDGRPADYVSSGVLSSDCLYSGYNGRKLPSFVE